MASTPDLAFFQPGCTVSHFTFRCCTSFSLSRNGFEFRNAKDDVSPVVQPCVHTHCTSQRRARGLQALPICSNRLVWYRTCGYFHGSSLEIHPGSYTNKSHGVLRRTHSCFQHVKPANCALVHSRIDGIAKCGSKLGDPMGFNCNAIHATTRNHRPNGCGPAFWVTPYSSL
jgi:hypothetical protein